MVRFGECEIERWQAVKMMRKADGVVGGRDSEFE